MDRPTPPGRSGAVCGACWRVFNSVGAFDYHQGLRGGVECRDPSDLGMVVLRQHQGHDVWGLSYRTDRRAAPMAITVSAAERDHQAAVRARSLQLAEARGHRTVWRT